ncbi:MAG: hypothetical protein CFE27_05445 [Alphaproteobacteria bacterium PA1]|nr:MAG: hypothetical protein CFE27_05445 [Alphaproteobacteria bacterium PA1]
MGRPTNKFGIEIAQTPEDKVTAGLQEVQGFLISGLFLLILTFAGCLTLVGKLGLSNENTAFLEQVSLLAAAIYIIIGILPFVFGVNSLWRRISTQPVLVSGRLRRWSNPSVYLSVLAAIVWIGGFALVVTTSYVDFTQGRDSSLALRFLSVPQVLGGCLGACAMFAGALETLGWVQDVRRDPGAPTKQAEQEPQLPSWAQTL